MKKFLVFFVSITVLLGSTFAYTLNQKEIKAIDYVEDKIVELIEENDQLHYDTIITILEKINTTRDLSERQQAIMDELLIRISDLQAYDDNMNEEYYLLPEDCYEDEYYDEEDERCYLNDDSEYGLDDDQDWEDSGEYEFHNEHDHENEEDSPLEASYGIQSDDSLTLTSGTENAQHQEVWELFTSLIAPSFRTDLLEVHFSRDPQSDTFAHVEQIEDNQQYWKMLLNLGLFYNENDTLDKKESIHTLIHEYSHILTLNKGQVTYTPLEDENIEKYEDACTTIYLQEGCLKKNAYLTSFIQAYWTEADRQEADEEGGAEYSETTFVSDYAATNPGEDIAESFTTFVLKKKPTGTTIKDKKVLFFYEYPELVKLRKLIRGRLSK